MIHKELRLLKKRKCLFDGDMRHSGRSWNQCMKCWYLKENAKVSCTSFLLPRWVF